MDDIAEQLRIGALRGMPLYNEARAEIEWLRAALEAIAKMKREDLYYADDQPHDNAAAAYAHAILNT